MRLVGTVLIPMSHRRPKDQTDIKDPYRSLTEYNTVGSSMLHDILGPKRPRKHKPRRPAAHNLGLPCVSIFVTDYLQDSGLVCWASRLSR